MRRRLELLRLAATLLLVALSACKREQGPEGALRLGFFPNVTHAQALVGHHEGAFRAALGTTPLEVKQFNAGPTAMEALLAGEIDVAYVGAGPAIIAYQKSGGRIRVVAGAASGGAVFVSRGVTSPMELHGKSLAAPQIGNTQDIALRYWLKRNGLVTSDRGGDVSVKVTPLGNPEILNLFRRGKLHGAWVPEPWASRLIVEGGGQVLLDERQLWPDGRFPTTVLVATTDALQHRRRDLQAIVDTHRRLTERARQDREAFARCTEAAFQALTGKKLPAEVMRQAFTRIELTTDPMEEALLETAAHAQEIGYLEAADIRGIVDRSLLPDTTAWAR